METALEHILTSTYKDEMIAYLKNHPDEFDEAVKLATSNKHPYSWRAAWLLWSCIEKNDPRIQKEMKNIINALNIDNDGQKRELLHILLLTDVNAKYEGRLFDKCISIWEDITKAPGVRMIAFRIIYNILKKHPELVHEMAYLVQDHYLDTMSPGIKHSITKLLKEFPIK